MGKRICFRDEYNNVLYCNTPRVLCRNFNPVWSSVCVQKIERDSPDLICSLLVPSRPLKVIFKEVTNSSVAVHWQQPTTPNGIIVGYRIYYMHDNFTDVQTVRHTEPNMFHVLRGLSKYFLMTDCYYAVGKTDIKLLRLLLTSFFFSFSPGFTWNAWNFMI